jgi:hypothetical protein
LNGAGSSAGISSPSAVRSLPEVMVPVGGVSVGRRKNHKPDASNKPTRNINKPREFNLVFLNKKSSGQK